MTEDQVDMLDKLYVLFDIYCEEVGINNYNEETEMNLSADEVLAELPDNSPHEPFVRAFIAYAEDLIG